ncbi:sensor protein QseC [Rhodobiaceae bacterium]|nr:sensor protein QseC [Rhodobiaceae bacterium]
MTKFVLSTRSLSQLLVGRVLALSIANFLIIFGAAYVHFGTEENDDRYLALNSFAMHVSMQYVATHTSSSEGTPLFVFEKPASVEDIEEAVEFVILDPLGQAVASSHGRKMAFLARLAQSSELAYFDYEDPVSSEHSNGISFPFILAGQLYVLQAGMEHSDLVSEETLAEELLEFSWGLLFLPLLLPLLVWTVRRSLAPLTEISAEAATIGPSTMNRRLSEGNVPDEVLPLVRAVNIALDQIEEGYGREREFAANAAHELRTPLAVLHSRAETLTSLDGVPDLLRDLGKIERIVAQLLRLAQADNLVIEHTQQASLRQAATTAISLMAPTAFKQGKEIELQGAEGPLTVKGDEEYLCMAIRNLLENALTVSPVGSTVLVVLHDPASLSVLDDGPGVPPDQTKRIFSRFVRGETTKFSGAGLGLSIVERIVAAHGGSVHVDSEEGHGAAFTITLNAE